MILPIIHLHANVASFLQSQVPCHPRGNQTQALVLEKDASTMGIGATSFFRTGAFASKYKFRNWKRLIGSPCLSVSGIHLDAM